MPMTFHSFIFLYEDLRKEYIPRYYRIRPNMFKCIELINTSNPTYIINLPHMYIKRLKHEIQPSFLGNVALH